MKKYLLLRLKTSLKDFEWQRISFKTVTESIRNPLIIKKKRKKNCDKRNNCVTCIYATHSYGYITKQSEQHQLYGHRAMNGSHQPSRQCAVQSDLGENLQLLSVCHAECDSYLGFNLSAFTRGMLGAAAFSLTGHERSSKESSGESSPH